MPLNQTIHLPRGNRLLDAIPETEFARLVPRLEEVEFELVRRCSIKVNESTAATARFDQLCPC